MALASQGELFLENRLKKTLTFAFTSSGLCSYVVYLIQSEANKRVDSCSYLDPIAVDILALGAGLFFIVESFVDILQHRDHPLLRQITRCIRMCLGASIITIHIMQFIHK